MLRATGSNEGRETIDLETPDLPRTQMLQNRILIGLPWARCTGKTGRRMAGTAGNAALELGFRCVLGECELKGQ
jgi:hypothetical protein